MDPKHREDEEGGFNILMFFLYFELAVAVPPNYINKKQNIACYRHPETKWQRPWDTRVGLSCASCASCEKANPRGQVLPVGMKTTLHKPNLTLTLQKQRLTTS